MLIQPRWGIWRMAWITYQKSTFNHPWHSERKKNFFFFFSEEHNLQIHPMILWKLSADIGRHGPSTEKKFSPRVSPKHNFTRQRSLLKKDFMWNDLNIPSRNSTVCELGKWPREIVDLPINNMAIFHSCLLTFTRGSLNIVFLHQFLSTKFSDLPKNGGFLKSFLGSPSPQVTMGFNPKSWFKSWCFLASPFFSATFPFCLYVQLVESSQRLWIPHLSSGRHFLKFDVPHLDSILKYCIAEIDFFLTHQNKYRYVYYIVFKPVIMIY